MIINLRVEEEPEILLELEKEMDIELAISEEVIYVADMPQYTGPYIVEPDFFVQKLETKSKSMKDDVTVLEIPIHEITNDYGTTFIVGGI